MLNIYVEQRDKDICMLLKIKCRIETCDRSLIIQMQLFHIKDVLKIFYDDVISARIFLNEIHIAK